MDEQGDGTGLYDEKRFQKDRVATSKGFGNTDPIGKKDMGVRFV